MAAPKSSFWGYVKSAFKNQWNLLVIGAGTLAAFISGHPDIALPVIAAVEMTYLVSTAGNTRFQHYVDNYQGRGKSSEDATLQQRFDELYNGLDDAAKTTWNDLRAGCEALGARPEGGHLDAIADEQLGGVNKLLWVHLKLLHTKARLERFFAATDEREMERSYLDAGRRLAALPAATPTDTPIRVQKRKSLEDTLSTLTARKQNVERARENHELVQLELARIASKLKGVVELAANRQDPGALTTEVDDAARSVQSTEQMIGELQSFTGLTTDDVEAPRILSMTQRAAAAGRVRAGG